MTDAPSHLVHPPVGDTAPSRHGVAALDRSFVAAAGRAQLRRSIWRMARARHLPAASRRYFRDLAEFRRLAAAAGQRVEIEPFPQLHDWTDETPFDAHYVYQGPWMFRRVLANAPSAHVDIASFIGYSGFLSAVVPTTFIDIRPTGATFPGFAERAGSVLDLPYADQSVESISCLHVIEHIGLGRYGDPLDATGDLKALRELVRVLRPGGRLYLSTPVGRARVCFNAHRVHAAADVVAAVDELTLESFSIVRDDGRMVEGTTLEAADGQEYACGMFEFRR